MITKYGTITITEEGIIASDFHLVGMTEIEAEELIKLWAIKRLTGAIPDEIPASSCETP